MQRSAIKLLFAAAGSGASHIQHHYKLYNGKEVKQAASQPGRTASGSVVLTIFSGANGFPTGCYTSLLGNLSNSGYHVAAVENRAVSHGASSMPKGFSFRGIASDIIAFAESDAFGRMKHNLKASLNDTVGGPDIKVVLMGHSMGATGSAMAAAMRPDLFDGLVMLEAASIPLHLYHVQRTLPYCILRQLNPVHFAVTKRDRFPSRQHFRDLLAKDKAYRRIPSHIIDHLATAMVRSTESSTFLGSGSEVELAFPKHAEAAYFTYPDHCWRRKDYPSLRIPILSVYGRPSLFASESDERRCRTYQPSAEVHRWTDNGHLLPLEVPDKTVTTVVDFYQRRC